MDIRTTGTLKGEISNVKVFNVAQPVPRKEGIKEDYFSIK
jgi:hypothetical protein